jgi:mono/diheme cytochrome c family protein
MTEFKKAAIGIIGLTMFGGSLLMTAPAQGELSASDPAAFYKTKCVACHGPKAAKRFDDTLTEVQLADAIIKGKKVEKPPNMPAYGEKGVTADQAKALYEYMKQLKCTP